MAQYVADRLTRGQSGLGQFAIAEFTDLKLSDTIAIDLTGRNAIEEWRRTPFMSCYVISENKSYRLGADVTIPGQVWTEIVYSDPNALVYDDVFDDEGFVKPELLRNLFINDSFVVDSEAEMLAMTSVTGNVFVRTDTGGVFLKLNNDDPSDISDFADITSNTGAVTSVNGMTGAVSVTISNLLSVPANLTAFNSAVNANSTVMGHTASIASLTTGKADLVSGKVPIAQLPYLFDNGITLSGSEVKLGGALLYDTEVALDAFNFKFNRTGAGKLGWDLGSDQAYDIYYRGSDGYIQRLQKGSEGQVLKISGGVLVYSNDLGGTTGGSVNWGSILGTITAQGDLISYLTTNYYDKTQADARYLQLTGGTLTGPLIIGAASSIDSVVTGGTDTLNIGTANADVINIGYSGSVVNIQGTLVYQNVTNLQVKDKLITLNKGGGVASGSSSGFEIEENSVITGYVTTSGARTGFDFKAPAISGIATYSLANLTGNRTYTLPDVAGTFLLSGATNTLAGHTTFNGSSFDMTLNPRGVIIHENSGGIFIEEFGGGMFLRGSTGGISMRQTNGGSIQVGSGSFDNGPISINNRNTITFNAYNATGSGKFNFVIDGRVATEGAVFTDLTSSPKGIQAGGDYSATMVSLSYITKGYVDALASGTNFLTTNTNQTGLSGNKSTSGNWTWTVGSGNTPIIVARTANFSASDKLTSWRNNTSTEVSFMNSDGTQQWNTYNTSGTKLGDIFTVVGGSGSGPALAFRNTAGTTRHDIHYNANQNNIHVYDNASAVGAHLVVGGDGTLARIAGETLLVKGDQNTGTYQLIHNSTNNTAARAISIMAAGVSDISNRLEVGTLAGSYSNSGMLQAGKGFISSVNTNGLNVGTTGSTPLQLWTNGTKRAEFLAGGQFLVGPSANAAIGAEGILLRNDQNAATFQAVVNNTSGTAASAVMLVSTSATYATSFQLLTTSAGYNTSGILEPSTAINYSNLTGGLNVGTSNSSPLKFWTNNTLRGQFNSSGQLLVGSSASAAIGNETILMRRDANDNNTFMLIINATNNTAASSGLAVSAGTAGTNSLGINALAPSFTSSGMFQASKGVINAANLSGLNIGTTISSPMQFWTNATLRGQYLSTGEFLIGPDATALSNAEVMQIRKDQNADTYLGIKNGTNSTASTARLIFAAGSDDFAGSAAVLKIGVAPSSFTTSGSIEPTTAFIQSFTTSGLNIAAQGVKTVKFWTNNLVRGRFEGNGGLAIGPNSLSADAILEAQSTLLGFRPPLMTTTQRNAISSPTDGLMVANSTSHTIDWYNGTAWFPLSVATTDIDTYYSFETDFITDSVNIFSSQIFTNGGGNGSSPTNSQFGVDGTEQVLGVMMLDTSTSTAGGSALLGNATGQITFGFGFTHDFTWRAAIETLSDGTNTFHIRAGYGDAISTQAGIVDGAYFRYSHGVNSGKWQAITISNSSETAQDTGVTAVVTTYNIFRIVTDPSAANVKFYINGTLTNTITTNIINSSARLTRTMFTIEKTAGSTARQFHIDYARHISSRTTAR